MNTIQNFEKAAIIFEMDFRIQIFVANVTSQLRMGKCLKQNDFTSICKFTSHDYRILNVQLQDVIFSLKRGTF